MSVDSILLRAGKDWLKLVVVKAFKIIISTVRIRYQIYNFIIFKFISTSSHQWTKRYELIIRSIPHTEHRTMMVND